MSELTVPRRFCGPPDSGNGGWTAGALAGLIPCPAADDHARAWPAIEVSLRQPPPLDTPMPVEIGAGTAVVSSNGADVATARAVESELPIVPPVELTAARAAEASYPGHDFHPFATCFSCGTGRAEGDGLRIFPGAVEGDRVAATWTPHPSMAEDFHAYADATTRASLAVTWAALDCIGGWAGDLTERLMVLGRMTARIDALPVIGEEHVLVGATSGSEGRKTFTSATMYDADGRVVASASHVWIAVDPELFGGQRP